MKTQFYTASTFNGFIASEAHSLEWLFAVGELDNSSYPQFIAGVGALVMGSGTYQWLLDNAEEVKAQTGSPWPYSQPCWVFSSRNLPQIAGADIRFCKGDIQNEFAAMQKAAAGKNIWVVGGGDLAGQFYDAGLLDELIVQYASACLSAGRPLLPRDITYPAIRLQSVSQLADKMVELRYSLHYSTADK